MMGLAKEEKEEAIIQECEVRQLDIVYIKSILHSNLYTYVYK
jgi:hypothetical protein